MPDQHPPAPALRAVDGRALADARRAAGIRPERLAVAVNRSVHTVTDYERGRVQPPVTVVDVYARMTGRTIESFLVDADQLAEAVQ